MTKYFMIIKEIIGIWSTCGQKPRNFQQNGFLKNRLGNSKRPKKLGHEELLIEGLVDQRSIKT